MTFDERPEATWWGTLRRVSAVVGVWVLMGLMLGMLAGQGRGPVALAISLTAGVIIMAPAGLFLALFGGRWDESLLGGMLGALAGFAAATLGGQPDPRHAAAACLVAGAFIGATGVAVFYRLPRFIAARVRAKSVTVPAGQ